MTLDDWVPARAAPRTPTDAPRAQAQAQTPIAGGSLQLPKTVFEPAKALRFVWREHPSIRTGRNFRLDFTAKLQADARHAGDEPSDFKTWELHRARAGIEGELFRKVQFQVEREFSENLVNDPNNSSTKSQWKDVYVELNLADAIQIRAGRFKLPFGLDQNSGEADLDFTYRSLGGDYLSPGRDVGGMVHGRFFHRGLNYWVGGFGQDGDNSRSSKIAGADTTFVARLTASVFRRTGLAFLKEAEVGGSFATSDVSDESFRPNGLRARTVVSQYTFFEPVFVKGTRRRYGAELETVRGAFGVRAEYIFVGDTRDAQGIAGQDLSTVRAKAWNVLGSWVVTGETRNRPVAPRKGGLGRGGVGAVELAARYDEIRFDSKAGQDAPSSNPRAETILPNSDKVFTGGVTYTANRWVKIQANVIHETILDLHRSPTASGGFWSSVLRLQFQL